MAKVREVYPLASITQEQLDRLNAYMHNAGGGYDFYTDRDATGEFMIVRSSKVEDRTTEPQHRLAVHAAEIRRVASRNNEASHPYQVVLVNLEDKTLRIDHAVTLMTLEQVLGKLVPAHKEVVSLLMR